MSACKIVFSKGRGPRDAEDGIVRFNANSRRKAFEHAHDILGIAQKETLTAKRLRAAGAIAFYWRSDQVVPRKRR